MRPDQEPWGQPNGPSPSKKTKERVTRVLQAIAVGAPLRLAAQYAGVSDDSVRRWLASDAAFAAAMQKAEGERTARWLMRIEKAAEGGAWQADAWKLERLYPEFYARAQLQVAHSGDVNVKAEIAQRIIARVDVGRFFGEIEAARQTAVSRSDAKQSRALVARASVGGDGRDVEMVEPPQGA